MPPFRTTERGIPQQNKVLLKFTQRKNGSERAVSSSHDIILHVVRFLFFKI